MLIPALHDIVGPDHLLVDPYVTVTYRTDWTGRFVGGDATVVRPADTAQVQAIVALCREHGVAIVAQGGNTGLVGGGVPMRGELVVNLGRMNAIGDIDPLAGQLSAQAGTPISAVQRAAAGAGWSYGVDLASRDTATVGGTIATNAGGLRVLRYGDTRAQVLGVEVVTGVPLVARSMSPLLRNNTGYHLASLLCGSEGTLGLVTEARLRLVPRYAERAVALLRFDNVEPAAAAAGRCRRDLPSADAIELFLGNGVELVCRLHRLAPPFGTVDGAYLLVEAASNDDPVTELAGVVDSLDGVVDVAVATDSVRREALWSYRERHTESISALGTPHKLDVAVPLAVLGGFISEVAAVVARTDASAQVWLFGHAGDGSVHVNVTGPGPDDYRVDDAVLDCVLSFGGTISAEHGIGVAKRSWLPRVRTADELSTFAAIKAAMDPSGILNPNALLS